jgi:hypothetical protein
VGVPPLARGTGVGLAFLLVVAVLSAWAAVAVHAHRRATRRRAALDLSAGHPGGGDLLWLAPLGIAALTVVWAGGGRDADPGVVLDDYRVAWEQGRPGDAASRFLAPPGPPAAIAETWERQLAALRNELLRVAAEHGDAAIDADRPLHAVRWSEAPSDGAAGTRIVAVVVARQEVQHGQLLGFLPTTSQRLTTIARLGEVRLRLVPEVGGLSGAWRIERVDVAGVSLIAAE